MRDTEAEWMGAMAAGDFTAAWALSDVVLASRDPAQSDDPTLPYHRRWVWDGRSFQNRHVLVRCYHGLGDTLQFVRYLPALRRASASVTLEVQPELYSLLARAPGADRLIAFRPDQPAQPRECDLEIMELAHALRIPPQDVPPPYLSCTTATHSLDAIGLCWQAGGWDAARSIPRASLAPLLATGLPFVSLCPGPADSVFINPAGSPPAIDALATQLAGLSLVITVDTMVAHLAGALGVPTWLMLKHDPDWRWTSAGSSPWYPAMRLFRQTCPGDWDGVLARVCEELTACSCPALQPVPRRA